MKIYSELKSIERDRRIKSVLNSESLTDEQRKTVKWFYEELVSMSRSEETISCYLHKIKKFGEFINKPYTSVTPSDFKKYLVFLSERKSKLNYINGYKIVLRVFYKRLKGIERNDDLFLIPLKIHKRAGPVKTESDVLSQDDIKRLVNATENYRDRFLIHGLYESGCRKSEFMNLKIKDIEVKQNLAEIISINGKTGFRKMRIPLITSFPDFIALKNNHPHRTRDDFRNSPVFVNLDNQDLGLGPYGLNDSLRKYQEKAKLSKGCYPHIFRHSRLTHLGQQGFTEIELRLFAGWSNSSSMASHYVHTQGKQVSNKIQAKNGIESEEMQEEQTIQKQLKPLKCMRCSKINSSGTKFCGDCGAILDIKTALDLQNATDFSSDVLEKTYEKKGGIQKDLIKEVLREMILKGEI